MEHISKNKKNIFDNKLLFLCKCVQNIHSNSLIKDSVMFVKYKNLPQKDFIAG